MEKEDGEMSDDNAMMVDELDPPITLEPHQEVTDSLSQKTDDHSIIKHLEKVDALKLEKRARVFGIDISGSKAITQQQIDELYANFAVEGDNERHFRFDTLHLSGVDGLSTKDVFDYLEDFNPVSLEWIDEVSCNIVCQDHISAVLALLIQSREIKQDDLKKKLAQKSRHYWREGYPHPKKDLILMRFATNGDKKMNKKKPDIRHINNYYDQITDSVSKNPWGDLCQTWGVYDHQEFFQRRLPYDDGEDEAEEQYNNKVPIKNKRLAMRLGKRNHKSEENSDSDSDSEWKAKSKTPRMRMRADDEESKQKKRIPPSTFHIREPSSERDEYAPLSIEVVNFKSNNVPRENTKLSDKFKAHNKSLTHKKPSIQSRLGSKVATDEDTSDDSSAHSEDHHVMSRVQKMNTNKANVTSSVWSRLETKTDDTETRSDLRQMLKSRGTKKPDDLRKRLGATKSSNLRIEIDNNYARS